MRYLFITIVGLSLLLWLAGCARYPTGNELGPNIPPLTLYSEITLADNIKPNHYYFMALNTDGTSQGPVPVIAGIGFGNGWGTISGTGPNDPVRQPPFFVEYYNGTFTQYRVNPATGVAESLGTPYRGQILAADRTPSIIGPIITVEVDARQIMPTGVALPSFVQLNWITMERIAQNPQEIGVSQQYDGFGADGNLYFQVPFDQTGPWISGVGSIPPQPSKNTLRPDTQDLNIINWRVEVRRQ